jgi:hypothetical protein
MAMSDIPDREEWSEQDWRGILLAIHNGKCTPFLGAGACFGILPLASDIANEWARDHDFPLDDPGDLARVAQFIAVKHGSMVPKWEIQQRFERIAPPDFMKTVDPHAVLADLPLPLYITTNYDDFMVRALRNRNKKPKQELCRWNKAVKEEPSVFDYEPVFTPSPDEPVVFHLHGHTGVPESLVLTEDDYLDFLMNISKDQNLIPPRIQRAFRETSLLFLGYQLADWNFRVLFRNLAGYLEKSVSQVHVSVQLVPGGDKSPGERKEKARDYLDSYFREKNVRVYWGKCENFVCELKKRWEAFQRGR